MNQERRIVLGVAGAGIGAALLKASGLFSSAFAADAAKGAKKDGAGTAAYAELVKTASDCIRTGELCAAHCQRELAKGNTAMAKCDQKVQEMLVLTRSMLTLASHGSPLVAKLAPVCAEACKACAEACSEHKEHFAHGMHQECKDCLEACESCEKACRKV